MGNTNSVNMIKVNKNGRVSRGSILDVITNSGNSKSNSNYLETKAHTFDADKFKKSTGTLAERRASAGIFSKTANAKIRSVGKLQKIRRTVSASDVRSNSKIRNRRRVAKRIIPR